MKARLAVFWGLVVVASSARASADRPFAAEFTKEALRTWCAVARSDEEVKREFGENPMVFGNFESVPGSDDQYFVDVIRFTCPIEELDDGGLRRVAAMTSEGPALTFRFWGHALIEVFIFRPHSDDPDELLWRRKSTEQNHPVHSNSGDAPRTLVRVTYGYYVKGEDEHFADTIQSQVSSAFATVGGRKPNKTADPRPVGASRDAGGSSED